jgi:hypothetical protein
MSPDRAAPPPEGNAEDVVRALERAAALEREVLAETRGPATGDEVRAVEAALRDAWAPRARGVSRRNAVWLAAAASVLATLAVWRAFRSDEPSPSVRLGENEVHILAPEGAVEAFTRIRWETSTRGTPRFEVRILDDATNVLLLREPDLHTTELSLENLDTGAWQRVRIEVDELDSSGEPVKVGRGLAWRRSP